MQFCTLARLSGEDETLRWRWVLAKAFVGVALAALSAFAEKSWAQESPVIVGKWSAVTNWPGVPIHATLLPNGKVLWWGRRDAGVADLDPDTTKTWIWDPGTNTSAATGNQPTYNLFCAGHALMPDGRVLAAGGHKEDGAGEPIASTFDYRTNQWERIGKLMNGGRWYPSVTALADGRMLVSFGTKADKTDNITQEIWDGSDWREIVGFRFPGDQPGYPARVPPYYPRMHLVQGGNVFMTGPLALTQILDVDEQDPNLPFPGDWDLLRDDLGHVASERAEKAREYGNSVLYDADKVIYIGGGNPPTAKCEVVNLKDSDRRWRHTGDMTLARRQHNATLLPDGTVLVTGGTKGDGAPNACQGSGDVPPGPGMKFNDLRPGQPLRSAEVWNPATNAWTRLAPAARDRCYHSVSLLLPDGRVLSAGGGEYRPFDTCGNKKANHANDTHANGQIFSPPYLFAAQGVEADRPLIAECPDEVGYGEEFTVKTPQAEDIERVTWVRLGSATHSYDSGQRINFLGSTPDGMDRLKVTAPSAADKCPPGHYMLFILNEDGVPSVSRIVRIHE